MQVQSVTYVEDQRLDSVGPATSLGTYDLFVDNPQAPDFCKANGITFANPPSGPVGDYDALYSCCKSVPPPSVMTVGETVTVKLRVKNTGSKPWSKSAGIRLGSYNGKWGMSRVDLPADVVVNTNQFYMFTFTIKVPSQPGEYIFKWGMRNENAPAGQKWFGQTFPCTPDATCQPGDCCDAICTGVMSIIVQSEPGGSCLGAVGSNCTAACPTDNLPDTDALQACISNLSSIELVAGNPGYIIDDGSGNAGENAALVITANKTLKTVGDGGKCWSMSGNNPVVDYANCALLKAAVPANNTPGNYLSRPMIKITGDGVSISRIIVDGEGAIRRGLSQLVGACSGGSGRPGNIRFFSPADNWNVQKSVSMDAMCGTALRARGSGYLIDNNLLWDNGASTASASQSQPWADGITAVLCNGGTIKQNTIIDATDVGIAGGGTGSENNSCNIHHNTIRQNNKHAFSGIGVAVFSEGKGEWGSLTLGTFSTIYKNTVVGNNKMDFGIHMGKHAWNGKNAARGGFVGHDLAGKGNSISGSSINLSVDGWLDGKVGNNELSSPSSTPIALANYDCCGSVAYGKNFTIGDYADNNGPSTLDNQQGTPDEELTTHVISATPCGAGCGSTSNCSVCEVPPANNCACRNTNGACVQCTFPQSIPIDEKEL